MDDLLNSMLNSAGDDSEDDEEKGDPMADLLGSLMGGAGGGQGASGTGSAGDMGDLLGSLMGGAGGSQGAGGMGDLLGGLMGGASGTGSAGAGSFLTPLVSSLADKLGLPPEVAQMVVSFAVDKLFAGARGGAMSASRSGGDALDGQDLNELLVQMNSSEGVDANLLESTGMVAELSEQTGLDADTAAASLQEVFGMLGSQQ